MKRQSIDNGGWLDLDTAVAYEEDNYFNGNNWISYATRSQWDHQEIFRTQKGTWVLHCYSNIQGTVETWTKITKEEATEWLIRNNTNVPEELLEFAIQDEV